MKTACLSRRAFLRSVAPAALALPCVPARVVRAAAAPDAPVDIGSRRELFVDEFLIDRLAGAELKLHKPEAREVALVCTAPWEGNTSAYFTFFRDGDRFRAYYRGSHYDDVNKKKHVHPEVACTAHSSDGVVWTKPNLGLHEFNGSKENNIVWTGAGTHNFTPFKDANPAAAPDARYKALAGGSTLVGGKKKSCLNALRSADGVRWTMMQEAVITAGAFDSQNLAFWDAVRGEYRAYWRFFTPSSTDAQGTKIPGVRAIRTATSKDFLHWDNLADLDYADAPPEHLYTNAVLPYDRAPHLFLGFPTRYQPKTQQVEPVFMTSRDGVHFRRWSEELIPITAPEDRDGNRSNYMAWGLLQLPGRDRELSVYAKEAYYKGPGSRIRRFVYRTDGFVSVRAPAEAELITRPLIFAGASLELNVNGSVRVEIQDAGGRPLPGFSLEDCRPVAGDHIAAAVAWKGGAGVAAFAGRPVRLRFILGPGDLYSMKFNA